MLHLAILTALATPAAGESPRAPQRAVAPPATPLPGPGDSDDIVVSALRIPRDKLPTGVFWSYPTILTSRIQRENADLFMRCALNLSGPDRLRAMVDGEPNSAAARFAQGRITAASRGCYPPVRTAGLTIPLVTGDLNAPVAVDVIDRGAIYERVLSVYAPDAGLTPQQTGDDAVRRRFKAREGVRNRFRLPSDRDGLVLAACLVREQPVFATRLMRSEPGSTLERGLIQALFVDGRSCLSGAKLVTIDPTFFRSYVADAFYRWVVASRDVDSLIPSEG